jgi:amino acid transporter
MTWHPGASKVPRMQPHEAAAPELRREFTYRSAFALAFAFISPIIGLYTIFALALGTAGPAFWLGFAVVLAGQLLVALVLAELSSVWPLAGGLYKWTQKLAGSRIGWAAGWAYTWTLIVLVTAQCYAAAPFMTGLLGIDAPRMGTLLLLAAVMLAVSTGVNVLGPKALKVFVALSLSAELIGSIVIGTILLFFYREQPLSAIFDGPAGGGTGASFGALLAAIALIGWSFIGFESAGDIAEEVEDPRRDVPRAIVFSLVVVALIVMYAALGLVLAIPDLGAAISGDVSDPIIGTITAHLGDGLARPLYAMVTVAFTAGIVAVQAAVSRVVFSLARDGQLPGSPMLRQLSGKDSLPRNAIGVTSAIAGVLLLLALSDDAYATLISMTTVGFYIAFAFPVFSALRARLAGDWTTGRWNIGSWDLPVNVIAALWLAFEIVNIAWPRLPDAPWYVSWGAVLMVVIVALLGVVVRGGMRMQEMPEPAVAEAA